MYKYLARYLLTLFELIKQKYITEKKIVPTTYIQWPTTLNHSTFYK